jgi:3'-phosphoadenosine 5'-phosphosulfate (PAPS) 3'-phosphatase
MTSTSAPSSTVNLLDLAASALASVVVAADQIVAFCKPELGEDAKNIRLKNDGTVVTDADMAAQSIIFQLVQRVSTDVRLIGEESPEEMAEQAITGHEDRSEAIFRLAQQEIRIRYNRLDEPLPLAQSNSSHSSESTVDTPPTSSEEASPTPLTRLEECDVDASRVSVIVDPLDGTKAYSSGDYGPVSILIAIVLDGIPCFGVICKPFGYAGQSSILDTGCVAIYGGSLLGTVYTAGAAVCNRTPSASKGSLPRAVISSSKAKGVVQQVVSELGGMGIIDPEPMMVSGAGEKSLRVILRSDNEGLWFYPKAGTSLWDVAASDAMLRSIGGRLTDKNGNDIDYNKSRDEAANKNGIVACYDKNIHETCIRLYLEGTWDESS